MSIWTSPDLALGALAAAVGAVLLVGGVLEHTLYRGVCADLGHAAWRLAQRPTRAAGRLAVGVALAVAVSLSRSHQRRALVRQRPGAIALPGAEE